MKLSVTFRWWSLDIIVGLAMASCGGQIALPFAVDYHESITSMGTRLWEVGLQFLMFRLDFELFHSRGKSNG